jgi:hypothetical protein
VSTWSSFIPQASDTRKPFVSYAWGDGSSEQARQRTDVVDRLCQRLTQEGWNVLRDNKVMLPGELISGFMKRIGRGENDSEEPDRGSRTHREGCCWLAGVTMGGLTYQT